MLQEPKTRGLIMKRFKQYVALRESGEIEAPNTGDDNLVKIIRLAWERYRPETKHFFGQLSNKDPDIKKLEGKLDNSQNPTDDRMDQERGDDTDDVVMPPSADTSPGLEDDDV
jgi:hypothetical protein